MPRPTWFTRAGGSHASVSAEARALIARDLSGVNAPARLDADGAFVSCNGFKGTAGGVLDETWRVVREAVADSSSGWVPLGRGGRDARVEYEYHVGRTFDEKLRADGTRGNRFFRLKTTLKVPPEAVVAALLDSQLLGEMDETIRYTGSIHEFSKQTRLVTVCASAGPRPFFVDRDDLDLTGWRRDADGVLWQLSVTVPTHLASVSTAVRNWTMWWGYKLEPVKQPDGSVHTRATLISQTEIFGWLPKALVNSMIYKILADYLTSLEEVVQHLPKQEYDEMLKEAGF